MKDLEIVELPEEVEKPKLPRHLQDRSKYTPHQGKRECERRKAKDASQHLRTV